MVLTCVVSKCVHVCSSKQQWDSVSVFQAIQSKHTLDEIDRKSLALLLCQLLVNRLMHGIDMKSNKESLHQLHFKFMFWYLVYVRGFEE